SAKLISFFPRSLGEDGVPWQAHLKAYYHLHKAMEYLKKHALDFDILHTHLSSSSDMYVFPLIANLGIPYITTLHSNFPFDRVEGDWIGDADHYYMEWLARAPLVAISERARKLEEGKFSLNFIGVVHHGLCLDDFAMAENGPEDYFAWLGRFIPEKGAHLAIEAARKTGVRLLLAGVVDAKLLAVKRYFQKYIEPELDGKQIQYIGPVNMPQKVDFLKRARGLLNPIQWEEPFGMVMIEAMAVGCPVIGFRRGAAPEIVQSDKAGFLVKNLDEMVACIKQIDRIDRSAVRQNVEKYFSAQSMAKNYMRIYRSVIHEHKKSTGDIFEQSRLRLAGIASDLRPKNQKAIASVEYPLPVEYPLEEVESLSYSPTLTQAKKHRTP
ncbi:MAG TPA: glycosyltransferase family 4 protein, partial [Ktedonobacteraceae bacterium]|nr:glycosyltransferase family 4 protein [Ktedonobacteraceae bacterium]